MTLDEARTVALICCQADSGCANCVRHLTQELNRRFPEFVWTYDELAERVPIRYEDAEEGDYAPTCVPIQVTPRP